MLIRLAFISVVLAIWLVMLPHSTEQSETPSKGDVAVLKPASSELAVSKDTNPALKSPSDKKKAKRKRMKKRRRKERRRKNKDKRRKRKKGRKGKRRKDRKKSMPRMLRRQLRKRRKNKKRRNKKRKKNKKYKKRRRKGARRKDRKDKWRNDGRVRRGRRRRGRPCKSDGDCKTNQCCLKDVCMRPGRGLKCFGSCMCKARKKTKNFICVTKKKKMLIHFQKYGNDTERVPRGHCRNITLTELAEPEQKFIQIKSPKPKATTPATAKAKN